MTTAHSGSAQHLSALRWASSRHRREWSRSARKISAWPIDLVVVDRAMPEMSGEQTARFIKQLNQNTPIIMLTGFGAPAEVTVLATTSRRRGAG